MREAEQSDEYHTQDDQPRLHFLGLGQIESLTLNEDATYVCHMPFTCVCVITMLSGVPVGEQMA